MAVIDEIQMIRDPARGWAWTRALLGLNAKEVHVCGEASAIGLINELAIAAGEEVEVRCWGIKELIMYTLCFDALEDTTLWEMLYWGIWKQIMSMLYYNLIPVKIIYCGGCFAIYERI